MAVTPPITANPDKVAELICDHCHTPYRMYKSHIPRRGRAKNYCSQSCKALGQVKPYPTQTDIDRFWDKVDRYDDVDACWIWNAAQTTTGYGKMAWPGRRGPYAAHRISFWIANGREAIGMVRHTCDTPLCVNPKHLVEGSQLDNMGDAAARGRSARGERNGQAILSPVDIVAIRARYKRRHPVDGGHVMAREYGVSQAAIMNIVNRKSWKHIL